MEVYLALNRIYLSNNRNQDFSGLYLQMGISLFACEEISRHFHFMGNLRLAPYCLVRKTNNYKFIKLII